VVSVLFALLTALFNGLASVLQRMAAQTAPAASALHLSLFSYLIRRKVWLAGIAMVVVASVCQATALATGPVALVQPIFIIELPFTLLVASRLARRKLPRRTWLAVGLVTVALGAGLAAAAPSGGGTEASPRVWTTALIVTAVFEAVVITVGVRARGNVRAAAFGLAAACGYALTATLLKSAVAALSQGIAPFFTSWQLYATAVAGVGALFLLQNALQAGSLVAVQPPLTLGDALISASYGVTVFDETVQTGGWLLVAEIAAVIAIAIGCIELSRSLAMVHEPKPPELPPVTRPPRCTERSRRFRGNAACHDRAERREHRAERREQYQTIAEAYRDLEQAGGRLALTERLAALLAQTPDELLPTVCYLCQGLIAPEFAGVDLGLAEKLAVRAVATATGTDPGQVAAGLRETGDLGQAAERLLTVTAADRPASLPVTVVVDTLHQIAEAEGPGSQGRKLDLLAGLLAQATPLEARYLLRLVTKGLRLGIGTPVPRRRRDPRGGAGPARGDPRGRGRRLRRLGRGIAPVR